MRGCADDGARPRGEFDWPLAKDDRGELLLGERGGDLGGDLAIFLRADDRGESPFFGEPSIGCIFFVARGCGDDGAAGLSFSAPSIEVFGEMDSFSS